MNENEIEEETKKTKKNMKEKKEKKQKRRIDKSEIAIKIVATFLTICMIVPIIISMVYYLVGE